MIQLFGNLSLSLALAFAIAQSALPLWGYYRQNKYLLAAARPAAYGQFAFVLIAYALLTIAFVTNDFSIAYVAENSHPALPFMYRLTATWGAHEGSILLWISLLSLWTIVYSLYATHTTSFENRALVLAILGIISFSFIGFLLFTSNPFLSAIAPISGKDLNPLLQDPGFVIHPPMLYTGYVGFAVAFAITEAALLRHQLDAAWASTARRFALAAWCFLTFGIALGSWWAYRVLGWGGFWFWDPVENASLLPWLSGTALVHTLLLAEKRNLAKEWAALLAIITFSLSLLGTFLVRSGVLVSAHTFANDPTRGLYLLILLAILMTAALIVYVARTPAVFTQAAIAYSRFSRESWLMLNSALLILAMLTILLGTLYPLILDALHLGTISVGAPYFNLVMTPIVFVILAAMGFAVLCRYQEQTAKDLLRASWKPALVSTVLAITLIWSFTGELNTTATLCLGFSLWMIACTLRSYRLLPGMTLAHIGFAILVIGIMLSSLLSQESEVRMKPGNATTLGPYQFFFLDTRGIHASNYRAIQASFEVLKKTRHVTNMYPEKRIYTVRGMVMTKVDIHPGIFRDLYIALGEPLDQDYWSVRIYYKPFIRWIWFGGFIMMIGGIIAMVQRRHRATTATHAGHPL